MSYCRFSEGDVYLYRDSLFGTLVCQACRFLEWPKSTVLLTEEEALGHLQEHIAVGHKVPQRAIERLEREIRRKGE